LRKTVRSLFGFVVGLCAFVVLHEGLHVVFASIFGEYRGIRIVWAGPIPFGIEVLMQSALEDVSGPEWILISGASNLATLAVGYVLFLSRDKLARAPHVLVKAIWFHATLIFMLIDGFNLSIGPFFYGGDVQGIARGLGGGQRAIQIVFLAVFLLNRELVAQKVLPAYGVSTRHPLFVPWLRLHRRRGKDTQSETPK